MTNTVVVQPDAEFIAGVLASGGADLKKCYQCATCVSVCSLSEGDLTFPRAQVVKAQWGMKEQLSGDPGVWLCHNCGECSTRCPRGARPGDILGAVRNQIIQAMAFPNFMTRLAARANAWTAVAFLIPALVLAALAVYPPILTPGQEAEFADLFPQARLEALFFTVSTLAVLAFAVGAVRLLRGLRASGAAGALFAGLPAALLVIATHRRFASCEEAPARFWGHMLTMFGFLGLAVMGTVVGIGSLLGWMHTPLPLLGPWKIFANLSALAIVAGVSVLLVHRLGDRKRRQNSTYFDWFFLLTLAAVVFTGIASEILRLGQVHGVMFAVYFVHLVLIFALFLYAPYSKFAHFLYRTLAIAVTAKRSQIHPESSTEAQPAAAGGQLSS